MQHKTHWKSVGFSCDSVLEHLSEVLFPVTTPNYGLEMRGRVGCFTAPIIGSGGGSECCPFWQSTGVGLWAQWSNLCSSCAWLAKSLRVTEGRVEPASPPSLFASCGVGIAGDGRPQAQGDFAKLTSLWAAATFHGFGRRNENAPRCTEVLIWIFIKLQLCIFYLSLIHLASWDITVLHSNYCENICILILWGLMSLSRI